MQVTHRPPNYCAALISHKNSCFLPRKCCQHWLRGVAPDSLFVWVHVYRSACINQKCRRVNPYSISAYSKESLSHAVQRGDLKRDTRPALLRRGKCIKRAFSYRCLPKMHRVMTDLTHVKSFIYYIIYKTMHLPHKAFCNHFCWAEQHALRN